MKLNLLHILYAILLCWGGLGLDNIFFESDALSKLHCVYGFVVQSEFHSSAMQISLHLMRI